MLIFHDCLRNRKVFSILGLLFGLTACGGITDEPVTPNVTVEVDTVTVISSEDMNNRWPVAVALVRSNDERLLERIGQLSAKDWFQQMEDFQRNYPELEIDIWEVVPSQQVGPVDVDPGEDLSGYIFADYRTTGAHRYRLSEGGNLILRMNQSDFTVAGEEAESGWWFF